MQPGSDRLRLVSFLLQDFVFFTAGSAMQVLLLLPLLPLLLDIKQPKQVCLADLCRGGAGGGRRGGGQKPICCCHQINTIVEPCYAKLCFGYAKRPF